MSCEKASSVMTIAITRFEPRFETAVHDFNQRIASNGFSEFKLDPRAETEDANTLVRWESWLAVQEDIVRGGYSLKHQNFLLSGRLRSIVFYNLSMSEGVWRPGSTSAADASVVSKN